MLDISTDNQHSLSTNDQPIDTTDDNSRQLSPAQDHLDINAWKAKLDKFVSDRNWQPFHNPKNLAMNLVGEAAEFMEIYTWHNNPDDAQVHQDPAVKEHLSQELGDVMMTVIMLADELDINLSEALYNKYQLTSQKYPAAQDDEPTPIKDKK